MEDIWEEHGRTILGILCIVLALTIFILVLVQDLEDRFDDIVTVHELIYYDGMWRLTYAQSSTSSSYMRIEKFVTEGGALSYIKRYDEDFYIEYIGVHNGK